MQPVLNKVSNTAYLASKWKNAVILFLFSFYFYYCFILFFLQQISITSRVGYLLTSSSKQMPSKTVLIRFDVEASVSER